MKRKRWSYSLRTGLILVTVFCYWLGFEVSRVKRQNHAIRRVREFGGEVFFAHSFPAKRFPHMNPGKWIPGWASNRFTDAYERMVVTVNFDNAPDMVTYRASDVTDEVGEGPWARTKAESTELAKKKR